MSAARRDLAEEVIRSITSQSTVPASIDAKDGKDPPSDRPTSVPSFDMSALASGSMPARDSAPSIPLDIVIPIKIATNLPAGASAGAVAVFESADGSSTLATIASRAGLSLPETISAFIELLGNGVIDVETEDKKGMPIASGVFRAIKDDE